MGSGVDKSAFNWNSRFVEFKAIDPSSWESMAPLKLKLYKINGEGRPVLPVSTRFRPDFQEVPPAPAIGFRNQPKDGIGTV
jgi:hypothetical protein